MEARTRASSAFFLSRAESSERSQRYDLHEGEEIAFRLPEALFLVLCARFRVLRVKPVISLLVQPGNAATRERVAEQARAREVSGSLPRRTRLHNVAYLYFCPYFEYARESTISQEAKAAAL
jgi:hypothetical protein